MTSHIIGQNEVCFEIEQNPNSSDPAFQCFTKYVNVLDCFEVFAQQNVSDEKVLHVAAVAAELLDNDEDGVVDDEMLFFALHSQQALMPVFTFDGNSCMENFEDNYEGEGVSAVLFRNEIDPNQPGHWGDDATVEEVLHTINHVGHVSIFPNVFGLSPNSSTMSDAMDIARGGQFLEVPDNYPEEAWYHYDDWTCDYECMAIEYLYWCIVTDMGILNDPQTCAGIANEWEPCSPELFETTDVIMHSVVNNPNYLLPQLAPDGNYCPENALEIPIAFNEGWNLVGLPVVLENTEYQNIFPESIDGTLYSFNNGYIQESELINGSGYWIRFENSGNVTITGNGLSQLIIELNQGWNLISGITWEILLENVDDPENLIIPGTFYTYSVGYDQVNSFQPGNGYWLRSTEPGSITLNHN
ncbi:MAG: hypothetical protein QGH24_01790 [Candidatus Marinimicrobia bacterium]|nr:hypothetical protein [Candidatus Neomarinimicrobiota bacterium]